MDTLSRIAPAVNPNQADREVADRLAWRNDSPDNHHEDGYPGPGWQEADGFEPSEEEEAFEKGHGIGREGGNPTILEAFGLEGAAGLTSIARRYYYAGLLLGRRRHAREAGRAQGQAGFGPVRPAAIARHLDRDFVAGWERGFDEWAARAEVEAEWEAEYEADCRAKMDQDFNREAGGWVRAELTRGGVE